MTLREVFEEVCSAKPNEYGEPLLTAWINCIEGRIASDVFQLPPAEVAALKYSYPGDLDTELLVAHPHDDLYVRWLEAQIDAQNGEYSKYQNSMQLYNAAFLDFVTWFARSYEPAQGYKDWLSAMGRHVDAPYYITAYGLAVKHGFRGSEEEWVRGLGGNTYPVEATEEMTQPVGIDRSGRLFTAPSAAVTDFYFPSDGDMLYIDRELTVPALAEDVFGALGSGTVRAVEVGEEETEYPVLYFPSAASYDEGSDCADVLVYAGGGDEPMVLHSYYRIE